MNNLRRLQLLENYLLEGMLEYWGRRVGGVCGWSDAVKRSVCTMVPLGGEVTLIELKCSATRIRSEDDVL